MNNYNNAINTLNALKENSHFAAFIREREKKNDGSVDPLENYLITPVQRIPRYSLLLNDLLKHTWKMHPDYENISKAFKRMNEVATEVNEKKRGRENQAKIIQLYNSLIIGKKYEWNKKLLLDQKNRKYLKEGSIIEALIKGKPTKFFAFLLNDLILWTKQKKNSYELVSVDDLSGAKAELKSNTDGSYVVHLRTGTGMRVFKGENDEDTSEWCKSLKIAIDPSFEMSLDQSIDYSVDVDDETKKNENKKSKNVKRETSDILLIHPDIDKLKPKKMRTTLKLSDLRFLEETEKRRSVRIDFERKKIESWQNIDDILEIMKYQSKDESLHKRFFSLYDIKVDSSYSIISNSLFLLGLQNEIPEFVFLGRKGDGKTSLVSALLGYPLPTIKLNRPLFIHMVNNQKHEKPYIWLRKDFSTKSHIADDVVIDSFDILEKEFNKRASKKISAHPVHLYFEQADLFNLVFILTPGLSEINWINETKQSKKISAESVTFSIASDTNRYLVFVEECKDKDLMSTASELASVVDPTFSRSIFVNTKFYFKIREMWRQQDILKYLNTNLDHVFYVTLPPYSSIDKDLIKEFKDRIFQTFLRDSEYLNNLQFDALNSSVVGIHRLRNFLLNIVAKKFYNSIPGLLSKISNEIDRTTHILADLEERKKHACSNSLRKIFSDYTFDFIKLLQQSLSGSTEIETKVFGQTLEDEDLLLNISWVDSLNQTILVKAKEWNIAYWDSKIYGSSQIVRLFSVFSSLVENMNFTSIQKEEIVASLRTARPLHTRSHYLKTAFDISHSMVERTLVPLVSQLYQRAIQIIKRLGFIAQTVIKTKTYCNRNKNFDDNLVLLSGYLRANFEDLVDELGLSLLEECSASVDQILIFDLSRYEVDISNDISEKNQINIVTQLVDRMCADISKQLVRDVTIKCYDILISKGYNKILIHLQTLISGMGDEEINYLFNSRSFVERIEREIYELNSSKMLAQNSFETILSMLDTKDPSKGTHKENNMLLSNTAQNNLKSSANLAPKKMMNTKQNLSTAKKVGNTPSKINEKVETSNGSRIRELKASLMSKDS